MNNTLMDSKIIVITGVMASGKATVAELLAGRFERGVNLRGDMFRKMIVTGRCEMSETPSEEALSQLDLRYRLTAQATVEYARAGFTVVVQDNYYGEQLPRFLSLLEPYPSQTVVLCPDAETVQRREAKRRKTSYVGFPVESLHKTFMDTTPRIGLWLDTSALTTEETVERIWRKLLDGDKTNL